MIFCFFQEYQDNETFKIVNKFKPIALRYARKSFIFDFLAWMPVDLILLLASNSDKVEINQHSDSFHLVRLLKMLRVPRLAELLDVEKFRSIVNNYY
jgi:hypothetical protein